VWGWSRSSAIAQESKTSKKGQVTPRGPKWGFPNFPPIFLDFGSLAHGPKIRVCKKHSLSVPLRGQLPIVSFWVPEGEWACGIGKGGCPHYVFWEGGMERPIVCIIGRASSKRRGSHCVRPQPSRCATGIDAPLLSGYIGVWKKGKGEGGGWR